MMRGGKKMQSGVRYLLVYMGSAPTINKKEHTNHGPSSMHILGLEYLLDACQKGPPELRGGWLSRNRNRVLQEGFLR